MVVTGQGRATTMSRLICGLVLAAAAAAVLGGCGEFKVCMNCFEHDAEKPLSEAQARSIVVDAGIKTLPIEARNVHFQEWCGIDCTQVFRFDLPSDKAHAVMQPFSKVAIAPVSDFDQGRLIRSQQADPPLSWWLRAPVPDAEGVATDVSIGQLTEFILVPDGAMTRVYMHAFDM
ncbi:hypothetical protein [Sphingopyxis sp. KK2]|uniref:hypothetical protein n=1 Tax=Sphingopyxis sp. KK2 TaxID=1855727 RepID=UPI001C4E2BF2|nr:hypothetical protein [Sphingopyxis sp. KK2]